MTIENLIRLKIDEARARVNGEMDEADIPATAEKKEKKEGGLKSRDYAAGAIGAAGATAVALAHGALRRRKERKKKEQMAMGFHRMHSPPMYSPAHQGYGGGYYGY